MNNAGTIQVLLVEDNPADARLVKERLAEAAGSLFRMECADRLATGASRLLEGGVDVVLLDLGLPDSQGLATFREIHSRQPDVPVVVLSGAADEDLAVEAVEAGAQDYLVKGTASCQVLTRALRYAIERKHAEENIRRLNAELERRVLARTAELEAANRELESFAYAISHDLRAPLRAVNGFAQIVVEDFAPHLPPEAQRKLRVIRERAIQMGQLIDGLLVLSRVGRQSLEKVPVDPTALARNVLEDLTPEREGRHVDVTLGTLPACQADPTLLKQVFMNLLSNALKYTRRREIAIVEIGAREQEGEWVYFVRDNGAGFDMRYRDKLFTVFQRLHLAGEFEGIGVGLSVVQRIVQRHGGRIWAEAEVDRGATFYFTVGK
ncbi:MAG TPA: ATP-binding protein [Bryobacteraceae bacterium]|nr:ATP-binding protein [Bryobacteraceae bacterium]